MLKYVIEFGYQIRVCHIGKTALLSFQKLAIFGALLIHLRPSNKLQVKEKYFFCRLKVFKFFHVLKFHRAMRVYIAQFQD